MNIFTTIAIVCVVAMGGLLFFQWQQREEEKAVLKAQIEKMARDQRKTAGLMNWPTYTPPTPRPTPALGTWKNPLNRSSYHN